MKSTVNQCLGRGQYIPRWWFQIFFFIVTPQTLGTWSNLPSIFFRWVAQPPKDTLKSFEIHLDQVCWIRICVGSQEMSLDSNKKMFVLRGLAAQRLPSLQSKISHPSGQLLSWWFSFYPLMGSGGSSGFLVGGEKSTYCKLVFWFLYPSRNYIKNPVLKPNFHCFMLHVFFFAACYICLSYYCSHLGPQNSFASHGAVCAAFLFSRGGGGCFSGSKDLRQPRRWVGGV